MTAAVAGPDLAVAIATDATSLAVLEPSWRDLWRRCPGASPFQSPDWLIPWWEAFHPGVLQVVAVSAGGRLVALAPLYREDGAHGKRLLPLGISLSDDTDVLVDPDAGGAGASLAAAVAALPEWEAWLQEDLLPGAAIFDLPLPGGVAVETSLQNARPVLAIDGERDADGLPLAVPADRRRKARRAARLAGERGGLRLVVDADPDEFLGHLERLHGARWQSRGEDGILTDDAVLAFHRAALPRLVASGVSRTILCEIGGAVAGAYYGLVHRGRAHAYLGGFDPAFAHESPGAILIAAAIRMAADEGCTAFDFLRGREDYKYLWGAVDIRTTRRTIRRRP